MSLFGKHEAMPEDKFVKMQKESLTMPREQMMANLMEMDKMCTCPSCPTYNQCAKDALETTYCVRGMSFHCIKELKECICPACPVTEKVGLTHQSFCIMGDEKTQRFNSMLRV